MERRSQTGTTIGTVRKGRVPGKQGRGLVSPGLKDRSSRYYTVAADNSSILCHLCGYQSTDCRDVRDKYCRRCRVFHEDRLLMLRLSEGHRLLLISP